MKNLEKIIKILKNNGVGIMPTDTLYGLVGSAFSKKAINRIYKIKKRNKKKKLIILISSISDLKKFGISKHFLLSQKMFTLLKKLWPHTTQGWRGKPEAVSVILNNIAFRLPAKKSLIEILEKTGPLVAPSANPEGLKPAENIAQAKKYFGDRVDFYLSAGTLKSEPSVLIKINNRGKIKILRGTIRGNEKL
jgi:L-threonylcarbamoyladenylate synthase